MLDGKNLQTKLIGGITKTNSIMGWFFGRTAHKYPVAINNKSQGERDDTGLLKCKTVLSVLFFFSVEINQYYWYILSSPQDNLIFK